MEGKRRRRAPSSNKSSDDGSCRFCFCSDNVVSLRSSSSLDMTRLAPFGHQIIATSEACSRIVHLAEEFGFGKNAKKENGKWW